MVLLGGLFAAAQFWLLGDTAVIDINAPATAAGLTVEVRRPVPGGLQSGDVVLALDGQAVDEWLRAGWRAPLADMGQAQADRLTYTVQREGQIVTVSQALQPLAVAQALRDTWSYLVFMVFMLAASGALMLVRPDLPASRALLLVGSAIACSSVPYFLGLRPSDLRFGWLVWAYVLAAVFVFAMLAAGALHFTLVFPDVQPVLRRRPWLARALYLGPVVPYAAAFFIGWDPASPPAAIFQRVVIATTGVSAVYFPLAVLSTVRVFRVTTEARLRRQLRWIVWGLVMAQAPWLALVVLPHLVGGGALLPPALVGLLWCLIPITIAIAVLREGLFDIDVLINRTLVYGALSAMLALAYLASVVVLQGVLRVVTGQQQSELVTVLSTLGIAALFTPLRKGVQDFIDRRFYRRKYDASKTLAQFGAGLRDEVELGALESRLVGAVDETMKPESVWLWRRQE
jgi:hypothetical protein